MLYGAQWAATQSGQPSCSLTCRPCRPDAPWSSAITHAAGRRPLLTAPTAPPAARHAAVASRDPAGCPWLLGCCVQARSEGRCGASSEENRRALTHATSAAAVWRGACGERSLSDGRSLKRAVDGSTLFESTHECPVQECASSLLVHSEVHSGSCTTPQAARPPSSHAPFPAILERSPGDRESCCVCVCAQPLLHTAHRHVSTGERESAQHTRSLARRRGSSSSSGGSRRPASLLLSPAHQRRPTCLSITLSTTATCDSWASAAHP
jgi:hypothetical protein